MLTLIDFRPLQPLAAGALGPREALASLSKPTLSASTPLSPSQKNFYGKISFFYGEKNAMQVVSIQVQSPAFAGLFHQNNPAPAFLKNLFYLKSVTRQTSPRQTTKWSPRDNFLSEIILKILEDVISNHLSIVNIVKLYLLIVKMPQ